jgi:hypothetical protein
MQSVSRNDTIAFAWLLQLPVPPSNSLLDLSPRLPLVRSKEAIPSMHHATSGISSEVWCPELAGTLSIGHWLFVIFFFDQDRPRQSLANHQMINNHSPMTNPTRCCRVLQPSALPNLVLDTKLRHFLLRVGVSNDKNTQSKKSSLLDGAREPE